VIKQIDTIEELIKDTHYKSEGEISWALISRYQSLSEKFIEKYQYKLDWSAVSRYQILSESFLKKYYYKIKEDDWNYILKHRTLSESFIEEHYDDLNWMYISQYQRLSEDFIEKYKDKVNWDRISQYQKLSKPFINKYKDKINIDVYNKINRKLSYQEKIEEVKKYVEKYSLSYDNKYFYAYRTHDDLGSGQFKKDIFYKKGKYYTDWHLDMRAEQENSFGLGVFRKGSIRVKIKIEDWGVEVIGANGKARVWGFEIY